MGGPAAGASVRGDGAVRGSFSIMSDNREDGMVSICAGCQGVESLFSL